ncbi:MAG: hypothetical protein A3D16_09870 [Rhodobacterales bacterium RIFCSPHIGHO2_02_FULL_62_130]|nr:MAG: hypothetical protein A3D16_09870 [Rhodobacterales bacterium RIFCSPHIGHO2_02_FULL_62_130]OHC56318.1 MAG: hypothetical protein A3E48_20795 [Rhodobacterales bacterium RIFCSPHIGHO2_12_FULL_62_75]
MSILNIIVGLVAIAFAVYSLLIFKVAAGGIHEVYGAVMLGSGGIIFAIAALILAIERRP